MKCPTCGYNSFESNDACPKCAANLQELKQTYGLTPVVFSSAYRQALAADYATGASAAAAAGGGEADFAFEPPAMHQYAVPAPSEAGAPASPPDPFAELLETSPQPVKAEAQQAASPFPDQGYELSSFSWEDTPETAAPAAETPQADAPVKEEDDFASLFGDLGDTKK